MAFKYAIERDTRDIGGGLKIEATFEDWPAAKLAWDNVQPDEDERIFMWLLRISDGNEPSHLNCSVVDCKVK